MREEDVIWNPLVHNYIEEHAYCFVDEAGTCLLPPEIPRLSIAYRRYLAHAHCDGKLCACIVRCARRVCLLPPEIPVTMARRRYMQSLEPFSHGMVTRVLGVSWQW